MWLGLELHAAPAESLEAREPGTQHGCPWGESAGSIRTGRMWLAVGLLRPEPVS